MPEGKMTRIELIGWFIIIIGFITNTILNITKGKRDRQNQQIIIDELEALRLELNNQKD